jgi:hypothetical protein
MPRSTSDGPIRNPKALSGYWPLALAARISNGVAHVIHIPVKKDALLDAISQFFHNSFPKGEGLGIYADEAYRSFGITG